MLLRLLAAFGICFALQYKFKSLRSLLERSPLLGRWIGCAFCVGFWSGLAVEAATSGIPVSLAAAVHLGTFAFASAAASYGLDRGTDYLETTTAYLKRLQRH